MALSKELDTLIKGLNKQFGGRITKGSDIPYLRRIPIGNPAYDEVSGGGTPLGRATELVGKPSSGKSHHAILNIIAFQKQNWKLIDESFEEERAVVYVDTEGTLDVSWCEHLGVDMGKLIHIVPKTVNDAVDVTQAFLLQKDVCLVVFDSLSAVGAPDEAEKGSESQQMALNARFWDKSRRVWQTSMNYNRENLPTMIFINSLTTNVGQMFGDPEKPKNGVGVDHYKSMSIKFTLLKEEKIGDKVVGRRLSLKAIKNKTAKAYSTRQCYLCMVSESYRKAGYIDDLGVLVEIGVEQDIIQTAGAYFKYAGLNIQGAEKFKQTLLDNDLVNDLRAEVYATF